MQNTGFGVALEMTTEGHKHALGGGGRLADEGAGRGGEGSLWLTFYKGRETLQEKIRESNDFALAGICTGAVRNAACRAGQPGPGSACLGRVQDRRRMQPET